MKITIKGQEIEIPEGAILEVVDGQIVFTPKQEEFKDGDILKEKRGHVIKYPKSWEEIFIGKKTTGYWINRTSIIEKANLEASKKDINVFKTEKQAKSALAYAQLTQLMALPCYNGNWKADWKNREIEKYAIIRIADKLIITNVFSVYYPISFKSREIANAFLKNNQELLKQYFQL